LAWTILAMATAYSKAISPTLPAMRGCGMAISTRLPSVIALWLLPWEPAATFCRQTIERLAQQYDAPVFVPHLASAIGNVSFREVASRVFSSASRS
jgi:hypothetical protein